ncbi:hypothetical protein GCM10018787_02340 [Streptomyces thermodiastaticus]|nr:hypothetical protein GCM10018787_02340 [Streptomyces thermodiastaticus]
MVFVTAWLPVGVGQEAACAGAPVVNMASETPSAAVAPITVRLMASRLAVDVISGVPFVSENPGRVRPRGARSPG